jgi:hypothetical protein
LSKGKFSLSRLTEKDVDECINTLLKKVGKALDPKIRNKNILKNMIYGPHAMTIIAKKGNKIVGFISGSAMMPNINVLYVFDIESSKSGLEGLLLDNYLESAKKQFPKVPYVLTQTATDDTRAIAFYSSQDFRIYGFRRGETENRDILLLRKQLSK